MRFATLAITALLVWALPSAAAQAAAPDSIRSGAAASAAAGKKRALKRAIRKCRTIRKVKRRKTCIRRARKRFAKKPSKPVKPVQPKPGKTWRVDVVDKVFNPDDLEIKLGDSVLWVWSNSNHDAHDVRLESGPPGIRRADYATPTAPSNNYRWKRTLPKAGSWVFYCSLHHLMRMTVKVGK